MTTQPIPINRAVSRRVANAPVAHHLTNVRGHSFDLDSFELIAFIEAAQTLELMTRVENFIDDEGGVALEVQTYLERIPITPDQVQACWALPEQWIWTDRTELRETDPEWSHILRDPRWQTHESRAIWLHTSEDATGFHVGAEDCQEGSYTWFAEFSNRRLAHPAATD